MKEFDQAARTSYLDNEWRRKLFPRFGITFDQYTTLFQEQEEVCAICHSPEVVAAHNQHNLERTRLQRLAVDHNHLTGAVRGLLCMACNTRLGYFEKNNLLTSMLHYISISEEN